MTESDEVITLPVPEMLSAVYLVAASDPPPDLVARLRRRVEHRFHPTLRGLVRTWLQESPEPVQVRPASDLPPPPLELLAAGGGATEADLDRIATATHMIVVAAKTRTTRVPTHAWTALGLAALVAEELDSDVIDVLTYQLHRAPAAMAALPTDDGTIRLADWILVESSPDRLGYWCTTNGLRRYGLPELQTLGTPPNVVEQWSHAMTGLAHALLGVWSRMLDANDGAAFVQLPATMSLTADDVALAYGRTPRGGLPVTVRLSLDPRSPEHHSFLTVHPPLHWSGSAGEHLSDACAVLFGARSSDVRPAYHGDAMDQAIATARAGLTDIRTRFESGHLHIRTKLLVKYAAPADEGTEYLWAYVTSWRDPYRILATSAADAVYHPKVRSGRPVVVDTASVVDWAVEHDDHGIIEGAWTQAALDD